MPAEQVHIVVRKPLIDIEAEIRRKYGVRSSLTDVSIEQDALVFTFQGGPQTSASHRSLKPESIGVVPGSPSTRKRRKHRVRNRMKTRGWDVVAKFTNSRGQSCTVYRPFYDALSTRRVTRREAYSIVRDILVSNGNNPNPSSIDYFLDNTLEYLAKQKPAPVTSL